MTAPASIRKADLNRIMDAAKAKGCTVEIMVGNIKIRVFPDIQQDRQQADGPMEIPDDIRL